MLQLLRDQKDTLDGVFEFVIGNRSLSVSYIKELHAALLRIQTTTEGIDSQGRYVDIPLIKEDWKVQPNSPHREGVTFAYCPPEQVASEMDRLIAMHSEHIEKGIPSDVQAAWLHHRFTQIHPFQDGNGRVARAIASLVLVKDGLFPLVVTRGDKAAYLNALEAADRHDLKLFIDLIAKLQITQFRKATAVSEAVLAQGDMTAILGDLMKAADNVAAEKVRALRGVFALASYLEADVRRRLQDVAPSIAIALHKVFSGGTAFVTGSSEDIRHYYRAQIIENAKSNLYYSADTRDFRSWVALSMHWSRRARLVFAFHGIGQPFNGSLICAPFLEFRDTDEEGQVRSAIVPVTEEGFVFFYNEGKDRLLARFGPWREGVLKFALKELTQNL